MADAPHPAPDSRPRTVFRRADWAKDLSTVRRLLQDYRDWLAEHQAPVSERGPDAEVALRRIDEEIAGLPGVYGPPGGDVILAIDEGEVAACGSLREWEPGVGELKRVYVRADHRGKGFGPRLTGALLDRARELRYRRVRVDALPTMYAAIEFYQEMGFRRIPPYRPHPVPGTLFFEYSFADAPASA
jgi:putative acetyltransferase